MSTETLISKPSPVVGVTPAVTAVPNATVFAATQVDKHQAGDKNVVAPAASHSKMESLQLLLGELASANSELRAAAAAALGRLADVAAAPALIAALNDTNAEVAREAAASLGFLRCATAVEPLIGVVENSDGYFHSVVREAAMHSLGQLKDVRSVEPLLHAIKDPIAEASAEAIRALAAIPDPRSLPALLEVVRNEHGFFLNTARRAAVLGLAKIGGPQAVCELGFVAANQWEDAVIRATAIEATREGTTAKVCGG